MGMESIPSNLTQALVMAQVIKTAVKDARAKEPVPNVSSVAKLDDALEHRKKNLRKDMPVTCYTHKVQFSNRRDFRLHIKYQHSTGQI
jgi:hypothetical protein